MICGHGCVGLLPNNAHLPLRSSWNAYPYGKQYTFGYTITKNTVSIWNGRARRYGQYNGDGTNVIFAAASNPTVVTFSDGAKQRIVWQWSPSGGLVINTSPQVNDPSDSAPVISGIVAIFDCNNGVPTISAAGGASDQLGHLLILPIEAPATV